MKTLAEVIQEKSTQWKGQSLQALSAGDATKSLAIWKCAKSLDHILVHAKSDAVRRHHDSSGKAEGGLCIAAVLTDAISRLVVGVAVHEVVKALAVNLAFGLVQAGNCYCEDDLCDLIAKILPILSEGLRLGAGSEVYAKALQSLREADESTRRPLEESP